MQWEGVIVIMCVNNWCGVSCDRHVIQQHEAWCVAASSPFHMLVLLQAVSWHFVSCPVIIPGMGRTAKTHTPAAR